MKKIIDTQVVDNANEFGEVLREYAFVEEYGCYSCFDLLDEFKPVIKGFDIEGRILMALGIHKLQDDPDCCSDELREKAKIFSNGDIHVGWYWDGDGVLTFIEGGRCAVNNDCKKDYTWTWCDC